MSNNNKEPFFTPKFYRFLGRKPPRTQSQFSEGILRQIGKRPQPKIPSNSDVTRPPGLPHPDAPSTKEGDIRRTSSNNNNNNTSDIIKRAARRSSIARGSIRNHSIEVRDAAIRSASAKMTVKRIIAEEKSYNAFLAFCDKEWGGENPRFLKAVQKYRALPSKEARLKEAQEIIRDYFSEECKHQVSLPASKLLRLMERSASVELCESGSLFDEANKMIERELSLDVFPRFLNSESFRQLYEQRRRSLKPKKPMLPTTKGITASQSQDSKSFYRKYLRKRVCPSRCEAVLKGWLEKKGGPYSITGWKRRWVVLRTDFVFYFTPHQSMSQHVVRPQGQIAVHEIVGLMKTRTSGGTPCFAINTAKRRYDFKCSSQTDRDNWYKELRTIWKASRNSR